MKYIGIDYGKKRIGVAVSDESGRVAFPLGAVDGGEKALKEVLDIANENGARVAVIGESRDLSGKANPIMQEIEKFAELLQENQIAVEFEPEFYTSAMADRQRNVSAGREVARKTKKPEPEHRDASAAALILQSYLDRMRQEETPQHEH